MLKRLRFKGIDGWNRPVFQAMNENGHPQREFYGATDILFNRDATEEKVLCQVTEGDLTYFGRTFGCEPMGTPAGNVVIVRPMRHPYKERMDYFHVCSCGTEFQGFINQTHCWHCIQKWLRKNPSIKL